MVTHATLPSPSSTILAAGCAGTVALTTAVFNCSPPFTVDRHGGRPAAEDPYLWTTGSGTGLRWHMLTHQKIDDARNATGAHNQCGYFPYIGGYAMSRTAALDGLWDHDFFDPGFGLNVSLRGGGSFCLARRERPKLATIDGRMWLTNGAMASGLPGDGPGDLGTFTFIQEVLSFGTPSTAGK